MAHGPIGLEGIDDLLVEYTRRKGINQEGLALLPEGGGWLLVDFGGEDDGGSRVAGARVDGALAGGPHSAVGAAFHTDRRRSMCGTFASPAWAQFHMFRASR